MWNKLHNVIGRIINKKTQSYAILRVRCLARLWHAHVVEYYTVVHMQQPAPWWNHDAEDIKKRTGGTISLIEGTWNSKSELIHLQEICTQVEKTKKREKEKINEYKI